MATAARRTDRPGASGRCPRAVGPVVVMVVVAVAVAIVLVRAAAPAGAQQPTGDGSDPAVSRRPIPILTIADVRVERCGPVALQGRSFTPGEPIVLTVNGTNVTSPPAGAPAAPDGDEAPVSTLVADASGGFTYTPTVSCDQESGFVQIRATDPTASVSIDVAVGPPPEPLEPSAGPTGTRPAGGGIRDGALLALRVLLAAVLAGELVLLWRIGAHRRTRRTRSSSEAVPT